MASRKGERDKKDIDEDDVRNDTTVDLYLPKIPTHFVDNPAFFIPLSTKTILFPFRAAERIARSHPAMLHTLRMVHF